MSQLNDDLAGAKLAAFMLLTAPGTPFVYYGEEIGMTGRKPDERIRTPMLWTVDPPAAGFSTVEAWEALSGDLVGVNVASESRDPDSLLSAYRDLVRVRSANPALGTGATAIVDGGAEPVIGWLRTTAGQTLLAVVNVSDAPVDAYALTLDGGPLCGPVTARLVGSIGGDPAAALAAPVVTAKGGLDAYVPLQRLAPRSGYLIALEPAP
jgi:glycosidase